MSYRGTTSTQQPNLIACDVTPAIELHMLNGTSSEVAIPCRYVVDGGLDPIHLTEEGYDNPVLALDRAVDGLDWEAWVDPEDDSIIRLVLNANCPAAIDKDVPLDFSLLITRTLPDMSTRNDSVIHGRLLIVAAPFAGGV